MRSASEQIEEIRKTMIDTLEKTGNGVEPGSPTEPYRHVMLKLMATIQFLDQLNLDVGELKKRRSIPPSSQRPPLPTIVCLCGSSRFFEDFQRINYELTMAGKIVLSVGFAPGPEHGEGVGCTPEDKIRLDELHLRKIDLCDEVYVINRDLYIGDSTRREILYARSLGRPIEYMEEPAPKESSDG